MKAPLLLLAVIVSAWVIAPAGQVRPRSASARKFKVLALAEWGGHYADNPCP